MGLKMYLIIPDNLLVQQLKFNGLLIAVNIALAFFIENATEETSFLNFFSGNIIK